MSKLIASELKNHPASEIFPMMSEPELNALAQDIKENGQREPVVVFEGLVLDGRNRLKACQLVKVDPKFLTKTLEEIGGSPTQYVLSTNLHRRHLTPVQAAAVAAEAVNLFTGEALKRQWTGKSADGEAGGRGKKKEGNPSVNSTLGFPQKTFPDQPKKQDDSGRSVVRAATATGSGVSSTRSMIAVKDKAPEVFQAAKEGKIGSVADAVRVAELEPEKRAVVIRRIEEKDRSVGTLKNEKSTAKEVKEALVELVGKDAVVSAARQIKKENPHVKNNSGEDEWYTPPYLIEAARACMGGIDLDPASSELANRTVKATTFYTQETNGLKQKWHGRVWMNPPYSAKLVGLFVEALATKFENREFKKAIILMNNGTDTEWFHRLMQVADGVCFLKGRVRFMDKNGRYGGTPLQGQMLIFVGCEQADVIDHFAALGSLLWR